MKKGMLLLTLAVFLLSLLPVIALAANETDMSTVITYRKDVPETSNPEPNPPDRILGHVKSYES